MNKTAPAILGLAICFSAIDAQACGEVMYRIGGALHYHAFKTRHPAAILLYTGPAALQHALAYDSKFQANLEKAGHKVTVARGPDELAQAMAAGPYDVIIAYAGDMTRVTIRIVKAAREPTLIPVLDRSATDEREMRERFPRMLREDADLNQFLRAIEQSMKAQAK